MKKFKIEVKYVLPEWNTYIEPRPTREYEARSFFEADSKFQIAKEIENTLMGWPWIIGAAISEIKVTIEKESQNVQIHKEKCKSNSSKIDQC